MLERLASAGLVQGVAVRERVRPGASMSRLQAVRHGSTMSVHWHGRWNSPIKRARENRALAKAMRLL